MFYALHFVAPGYYEDAFGSATIHREGKKWTVYGGCTNAGDFDRFPVLAVCDSFKEAKKAYFGREDIRITY